MQNTSFRFTLFFIATFSMLSACYYDNEETLYSGSANCDTTDFAFSTRINPIIENSCLSGCHSQASGSGGIVLEGYINITNSAASGDLMCVISHQSGCSPMPKNSPKLSDCDIQAVQRWIDNGTPDN
jgi:hypothetical protein